MTLLVARLLLALGLLPSRAHPPVPLRRALIARHIHDTTYPQRIDK
jgi:hypothetical protein